MAEPEINASMAAERPKVDAHGEPIWPSNPPEAGDCARDGKQGSRSADTMGMSVALDGDARQAAAARLAEEQGLVRKAQAGDRLAFEELVRRYDREVLPTGDESGTAPPGRCARYLSRRVSLRAYRNLHRFRFECSFYTWLYRIVTNVALDHLRRQELRAAKNSGRPLWLEKDGGAAQEFLRSPTGVEREPPIPKSSLLGQELGPTTFRKR